MQNSVPPDKRAHRFFDLLAIQKFTPHIETIVNIALLRVGPVDPLCNLIASYWSVVKGFCLHRDGTSINKRAKVSRVLLRRARDTAALLLAEIFRRSSPTLRARVRRLEISLLFLHQFSVTCKGLEIAFRGRARARLRDTAKAEGNLSRVQVAAVVRPSPPVPGVLLYFTLATHRRCCPRVWDPGCAHMWIGGVRCGATRERRGHGVP